MIFFISELDARDNISEHRSAKYQISWHQDLFDHMLVFGTENHASSEKKKPYSYGQKKENSFEDFK
jgi:hypothetical protein